MIRTHSHLTVQRTCDDLRIGFLTDEAANGVRVSTQDVTEKNCQLRAQRDQLGGLEFSQTYILLLVRISHTRAAPSRPPVTSTSSVGCRASAYTPDR